MEMHWNINYSLLFEQCLRLISDMVLDFSRLPILLIDYDASHNVLKMVKHTQTIRQQTADELFEYVWPFCRIVA